MLVKCGSGNLSLFTQAVCMAIKTELCCADNVITIHSLVFKSFSGLQKMGNNFPAMKICHNPEHVNSGIIILLTTLDGNMNSVHVSLCTLNFPYMKTNKCLS